MNFLTRHFKQYPIPTILEDYSCPHSAYFQWPEIDPVIIDDNEFWLPFGAIVINPSIITDEYHLANSIAHEYRHFLQFCVLGCGWVVPRWDDFDGLDRYWINHPCERDAYSFASSFCSSHYYDDFCLTSGIGIMSRSESILLPRMRKKILLIR